MTGRYRQRDHVVRRTSNSIRLSRAALTELLNEQVIQPFRELTGLTAQVAVLGESDNANDDETATLPAHPLCTPITDRCRVSWQTQVAHVRTSCQTVWHRCHSERFCGVAPIRNGQDVVALVRTVNRDTRDEAAFTQQLDVLHVLIDNFQFANAAALQQPSDAAPTDHSANAAKTTRPNDTGDAESLPRIDVQHPQVRRALAYIETHLTNSTMNVAGIASALGSHPDYLAHLFAEQVGQRMRRYITQRRISLAKRLLAQTDWQIKHIAWACGFTNPNWFSHAFRIQTDLRPTEFRARAIEQATCLADETAQNSAARL